MIQLTTKTQPVEATDDAFWDQFWVDSSTTIQDVFALVPAAEIRAVREESPSNLATLCYKAVERLVQAADSGCPSEKQRQIVLNCVRLLTRILPYIFEDADWRGFFWSTVPGAGRAGRLDEDDGEDEARPLAESLLLAIADLLFCPDFTAQSHKKSSADAAEDIQSIDSCEYIWEAGVGFAQTPPLNYVHDINRTELLKLLLTCFSEAMYLPPSSERKKPQPLGLLLLLHREQTRPAALHLPAQRGVCVRPRRLRLPVQPPAVLRPAGAAGGAGGPDPHRHPGAGGRVGRRRRPAGPGQVCVSVS